MVLDAAAPTLTPALDGPFRTTVPNNLSCMSSSHSLASPSRSSVSTLIASAYLTAWLGSTPTAMKDCERSRVAEVLLRRSARGSCASASHRARCASSALRADATAAAETRLLSALSITALGGVRLQHECSACRTSGWRSKALDGARPTSTLQTALIFAMVGE